MSRISQRFKQLADQGRKAVIPYIVAGDPSVALTVPVMHRLVECGADIIELGVPFSDPMAEGPVIQQGHERALDNGVTLGVALEMVREFRRDDATTPVLLMGYANPVLRMGCGAFVDEAVAAGLDGLLTVDLPPEEVDEMNEQLKRVGMDNIFLVAPTTPEDRVATIAKRASGFIYYVALKGVTGAGHLDTGEVMERVAQIRQCTDLPVAVGFGIKNAESARSIAAVADGVVVGSALVSAMAAADSPAAIMEAAETLINNIRRGVDVATS